jgi:hypothetical protein
MRPRIPSWTLLLKMEKEIRQRDYHVARDSWATIIRNWYRYVIILSRSFIVSVDRKDVSSSFKEGTLFSRLKILSHERFSTRWLPFGTNEIASTCSLRLVRNGCFSSRSRYSSFRLGLIKFRVSVSLKSRDQFLGPACCAYTQHSSPFSRVIETDNGKPLLAGIARSWRLWISAPA